MRSPHEMSFYGPNSPGATGNLPRSTRPSRHSGSRDSGIQRGLFQEALGDSPVASSAWNLPSSLASLGIWHAWWVDSALDRISCRKHAVPACPPTSIFTAFGADLGLGIWTGFREAESGIRIPVSEFRLAGQGIDAPTENKQKPCLFDKTKHN